MKCVREYINEKFTSDSDPIISMGIGAINHFKELPALFGKADFENRYIFTIYVRHGYIDFFYNHPIIKLLNISKTEKLFDYIKNIIKELGFSSILINPIIMKETNSVKKLPVIIRFEIILLAQNILKYGSYRRASKKSLTFTYFSGDVTDETYEKELDDFIHSRE